MRNKYINLFIKKDRQHCQLETIEDQRKRTRQHLITAALSFNKQAHQQLTPWFSPEQVQLRQTVKVVKELFHSSDHDQTQSKSKNLSLCWEFVTVFHVLIIVSLQDQITQTSHLCQTLHICRLRSTSGPPIHCSPLFTFLAVTTAEALKLVNLSSKSSPMNFISSPLIKFCPIIFSKI